MCTASFTLGIGRCRQVCFGGWLKKTRTGRPGGGTARVWRRRPTWRRGRMRPPPAPAEPTPGSRCCPADKSDSGSPSPCVVVQNQTSTACYARPADDLACQRPQRPRQVAAAALRHGHAALRVCTAGWVLCTRCTQMHEGQDDVASQKAFGRNFGRDFGRNFGRNFGSLAPAHAASFDECSE